MKYFPLTLLAMVLSVSTANAQSGALKQFLETGFMLTFDSIRADAESTVSDYKAVEHEFDAVLSAQLRDKYDSAAGLFNNALLKVKADMLSKRKRKFIRKHPELYTQEVEKSLKMAQVKYEEFVKLYQAEVDDAFCIPCIIGVVMSLYDVAEQGFAIFQTVKGKFRELREASLDRYLIQEHYFKIWDDIS